MNALLRTLEKFRLTTKLVLGFSAGIVIALTIGVNALFSLNALETSMEAMYEKDLLGITHVKDANLNLIYMSRAMRHMLIAQDDVTRDSAHAAIKRARENLMVELAEARKRMFRPDVIERYELLQSDLTRFLEGIEHAVSLIQREEMRSSAAARFITSPEFGAIVAKADNGLHELTQMKSRAADEALALARENTARAKMLALVLLAAGVVAAALLGVLIGLSIQRPNDRLRASVEALAAGQIDAPIPHIDYPNEIGVMARAINVLKGIYQQANEQHWTKSHVAEISAAMQHAEDMQSLAQRTVSALAPLVQAGHAAFYAAEGDSHYALLASYGYRERKTIASRFRIGEGLVGQCVMERSTIMLTAPKDYIRIGSGLGEGPPACIIVLPVMHGERVLGVLELAAFQTFSERDRVLMDALLPALATSVEILDRNLRTRELLAATQEQAERMEKQAAQLEEQTVEMEAQQAELLETENWFRSIIETAPDGMLVSDNQGRILLANPMAEQIFGYANGELIHASIESLVPESFHPGHATWRTDFMTEGRRRQMGRNQPIVAKHKDGHEFTITVALSPLPPRGDRGRCVSVAVRKIEP